MGNGELITYRQGNGCKLCCELDLLKLYPDHNKLGEAQDRFRRFMKSDDDLKDIYRLDGNRLFYDSEQLIPEKTNGKPSLLMVFGNPAPLSIKQGMFFGYEGDRKEHRFWKHILKGAGINGLIFEDGVSVEERNEQRRTRVFDLKYKAQVRLGFCVYISMPSPASHEKWGGVAGIHRLFGKNAMAVISKYETERVLKIAKRFLSDGGKAAAFQKNAWEGLRAEKDPQYKLELAKKGKLIGSLRGMNDIPLYGLPPTRLTGPCREALKELLVKR